MHEPELTTRTQPRISARHATMVACTLLFLSAGGAWLVWNHAAGEDLSPLLRQHYDALRAWQSSEPVIFLLGFTLVFALVSALTLPGGMPLCLLAGGAFGVAGGALVLGVASTLGALLSFLVTRHFARAPAERLLGRRLRLVDRVVSSRGGWRLFWLRVVPLVPFPLLNPLLGLSRMTVDRFLWPSLAGLTLSSLPYTWAGQSLGALLAGESSGLALAGACASLLILWLLIRFVPEPSEEDASG